MINISSEMKNIKSIGFMKFKETTTSCNCQVKKLQLVVIATKCWQNDYEKVKLELQLVVTITTDCKHITTDCSVELTVTWC